MASHPRFSRDLSRQSFLPIKRDERGLDVGNDGFHLDDEHDALFWMEGEHIDRTALAVDAEADLGRDKPFGDAERSDDGFDDCRVLSIEEPIQTFAVPRQAARDTTAERRGDLV